MEKLKKRSKKKISVRASRKTGGDQLEEEEEEKTSVGEKEKEGIVHCEEDE